MVPIGAVFLNTEGITLHGADWRRVLNKEGVTIHGADWRHVLNTEGITLHGADWRRVLNTEGITTPGNPERFATLGVYNQPLQASKKGLLSGVGPFLG